MPLQALIAEASRYARYTMKQNAFLTPIMMATTDQGIILFTPDSLSDTGDKDDFANKVRLITGAYGATAVVLIVESWITKPRRRRNSTRRHHLWNPTTGKKWWC